MSIDVKRVKRVIQTDSSGSNPLNEFNAGVNKPAFRSNGYQLTFNSSEKDYYRSSCSNIVDTDSIDFEIVINVADVSNFITFVEITPNSGGFNDSLGIYRQNSTTLRVRTFAGGSADDIAVPFVNDVVRIGVNNLGVYLDGVLVGTFLSRVFSTPINLVTIASRYNLSNYTPLTLYKYSLLGELFSFGESKGNSIEGSNGTVGNILTSNIGGVTYIDSTIWNKKSFGLIGEPLDNEKVTINGNDYFLTATATSILEDGGELFYLTEGLGNEVIGDLGTIGVITTDNINGINRINYGIWNKGSYYDGWSPYL